MEVSQRLGESDADYEARKKRIKAVHRSSNFNPINAVGGGVSIEIIAWKALDIPSEINYSLTVGLSIPTKIIYTTKDV